jgi:hypothetical protein|tara:strand:- start:19 stop:657 length:639 start_codon:yes stop_codon:yes gene_type:complete
MEENKVTKPKLLIVTGPQGSGNHLFAKLFTMHPSVEGWPMLREEWQGHHEEPFAPAWEKPALLKDKPWQNDMSYMTSISCPYIKGNEPHTPKYKEFITEAKKHCDVVIAIIGRDRNILETQQNRLRDAHTTPQALEQFEQLKSLAPVHYISQELFFLYGEDYMHNLGKQMDFPILCPSEIYRDYLKKDSNNKYIQPAEGRFDKEVRQACEES